MNVTLTPQINVTLTLQIEELIRQKIESGQYSSPEEVLAEALRLLDLRDRKLAALRQDVRVGLEQLERGEYIEYTDETLHELFDSISERGRKWLESRSAEQSADG